MFFYMRCVKEIKCFVNLFKKYESIKKFAVNVYTYIYI